MCEVKIAAIPTFWGCCVGYINFYVQSLRIVPGSR
jgi:hypothetical protein